ncbi:DM13 domain-containing protein [Catellatospora sp. TT07R-123]|uniref:DM13 domain-containing protein n=1 Tax=Catellatospora sp. TT07R-123 TaxID=2733863 RepID=UPI001BB4280B|nr:DM13 domain-containing protein [Catellatospora sp. TT07R-123]
MRQLLRRPVYRVLAGVVVLALAFGLYWFAPWKLFTGKTVNDAVPEAVYASGVPLPHVTDSPSPPPVPGQDPHKTVAVVVAQGELVSHEHPSKGYVELVWLPNGRYQVILRDLGTSDGPDLHVWLTDQPVKPGQDGWRVFDDGKHTDLGKLKGTRGTQVYDVPKGVDPKKMRSVTIWCERFSVSFAAAPLQF